MLLRGVDSVDAADDVAQRVLDELLRPYIVDGDACHAGASIGLALHEPGQSATDILQRADTAMYDAKATGKGQVAHVRGPRSATVADAPHAAR